MSEKLAGPAGKIPLTSLKNASAEAIENLQLISEVFQQIEKETAEIAEMIFEYLIDVDDAQVATGTIPPTGNKRVDRYIKILNRLFLFSKKYFRQSGVRIINRRVVKDLDKKTFAICMCFDGGVSLDILCDIVNEENRVRTPNISPVRLTIEQVFAEQEKVKNKN